MGIEPRFEDRPVRGWDEEFYEGFLEDEAVAGAPAEDGVCGADAVDGGLGGDGPPAFVVQGEEFLGDGAGFGAEALLAPGEGIQFAREMAPEEPGYIVAVDGVAPKGQRLGRRNVQRWTVPVYLAESRGSGVAPAAVGEVIPGGFAAEGALSLGDGKGVGARVDGALRDAGFVFGGFERGVAGVWVRGAGDDDAVAGARVDGGEAAAVFAAEGAGGRGEVGAGGELDGVVVVGVVEGLGDEMAVFEDVGDGLFEVQGVEVEASSRGARLAFEVLYDLAQYFDALLLHQLVVAFYGV